MSSPRIGFKNLTSNVESSLSPRVLATNAEMGVTTPFTFPKQHLAPRPDETSSNEASTQPVSLLTSLLQSPEHGRHLTSGPPSTRSSAPSTALSSPNGLHTLQQKDLGAASILLRGSTSASSDADGVGLGIGVNGMERLAGKLEKVDEKRERIGWAEIEPPLHPPSAHRTLKFAVAAPPALSATLTAATPYVDDLRGHRVDDDDGLPCPEQDESDSDLGYEEDEENGLFSDDDDYITSIPRAPSPSKFPFARPTNYYWRRSRKQFPSAAPAHPAVFHPQSRGRGHIRLADTAKERIGCTRHCSPPPQDTDAAGPSRGRDSPNRSDAGPRNGRAGSPMPQKIPDDDDDEEDRDEQEPSPPRARGGWRSDDAVFSDQVHGLDIARLECLPRNVSAPPIRPVFDDSEDDIPRSVPSEHQASFGVREFLRRASEHIPGLSTMHTEEPGSSIDAPRNPATAPLLSQTTCPPALDDTPIMAGSTSRSEAESSSGLAHRLERTLSSQPRDLSRTSPLEPRLTFQANAVLSGLITGSADEGKKRLPSMSIACPAKRSEDMVGWSS